MVTAGFVFALWHPVPVGALRVQIVVILSLAIANFYLHTQLLRRRVALEAVVFGASAADLVLITILVASGGGFESQVYIFYYPAVLAFAVTFPPFVTTVLTGATVAAYLVVGTDAIPTAETAEMVATRIGALLAVAACGYLYRRIERDRRGETAGGGAAATGPVVSPGREAAKDLFFGQLVIIIARWALIGACAALVLWSAIDESQLVSSILPVVALMAMNFFLHGRYLLERPANWIMTVAAAALDVIVITAIVAGWPGARGLESQFFVFYYPALMAFAFVFPPPVAAIYTGIALVAYVAACIGVDASFLDDGRLVELLVQRVTTLAAVGVLAAYYWRVQRARRRAAIG